MDAYSSLRDISLFSGLDDEDVRSLADRAVLRRFEAGERIASQTEEIQAFFIVLSGRVKIFRTNAEGKEQTFYVVEGGQPFCLCTAFADKSYPVDVSALEPSLVASIPANDMENLAHQKPILMLRVMQAMAARLLETMNLVESLTLQGTQERVALYLLHAEAGAAPRTGEPFTLPMTYREMARLLGTTPETLSRIIQRFKRDEWIASGGKRMHILDHDSLRGATGAA